MSAKSANSLIKAPTWTNRQPGGGVVHWARTNGASMNDRSRGGPAGLDSARGVVNPGSERSFLLKPRRRDEMRRPGFHPGFFNVGCAGWNSAQGPRGPGSSPGLRFSYSAATTPVARAFGNGTRRSASSSQSFNLKLAIACGQRISSCTRSSSGRFFCAWRRRKDGIAGL